MSTEFCRQRRQNLKKNFVISVAMNYFKSLEEYVNMTDIIKTSEYLDWLRDLKRQIKTGQIKAALSVIVPQAVG